MNMTLDKYEPSKSLTSIAVVAAIHVAVILGLLFGLKTMSVDVAHENNLDVTPLPPEHPKLVEHENKPLVVNPVILTDPIIPPPPVITDPNPYPAPVPPQPWHAGGDPVVAQGTSETRGDVFTAAVVDARSCDKPAYPRNAQRNGDTGVVTLELLIGPDGKVADSKIAHSSGHRDLDQAAVAGLSLCKFKPATLNGQAQKSWAKLQYAWNLDNN